MEYAAQKNYPPIFINRKHKDYAYEMLSNIGGKNSEISAVTSYFYNHLVIGSEAKEISEIFHKISLVEMHHLEIFGTLAMKLGADPRLWNPKGKNVNYWSPEFLDYQSGAHAILSSAIEAEQNAILKYKKQASYIRDLNIVYILNRIIEDEEIHVKIFKDLLSRY